MALPSPDATHVVEKILIECPVCRQKIKAETVVEVRIEKPYFGDYAQPKVTANAKMVGLKVEHECDIRTENKND